MANYEDAILCVSWKRRMEMKKVIVLIIVLSLTAVSAVTNITKIEFNAKTGDKELDVSLSQLNIEANLDIKTFNKEMVASFDITEKNLEMLRVKNKLEPSDVYMALEVAKASGKPVKEIILSYKGDKEKGWGEVAKKMGIKPGSKKFMKLKSRIRERHQNKEKKKLGKAKEIKKKSNTNTDNHIKKYNQSRGKGKK